MIVAGAAAAERATLSEKGSVLIFPKVEIRWDANENLYMDTFISLTNDFESDVEVTMYFVREICTDIDVHTALTRNQPAYWSAATGFPGPDDNNVPVFGTLADAIEDPNGEYYLRGYIVVFAVNNQGEQIRWNHLFGEATCINYRDGSAWEYNAYAFKALQGDNGVEVGTPGEIMLDDNYFSIGFNKLLFDFYAPGSHAFLGGENTAIVDSAVDTDLTLMILEQDLRLNTEGPFRTLVVFETWDENETGLTGDTLCFQKWTSFLLSQFGGHFMTMQTDRGYSRLDAVQHGDCDVMELDDDGEPMVAVPSIDTPLLGVAVKLIDFFNANDQIQANGAAGGALRGSGTQAASFYFDVSGGGSEEKDAGSTGMVPFRTAVPATNSMVR